MNTDKLWQHLRPMLGQNPEYQQALQRLKDIEPDYLKLLETLSPGQRDILERYIAATEALDDPLLFLAYQIGVHQRLLLE